MDIAFCDNDTEAPPETEDKVRALGRKALAMEADVSDRDAVTQLHVDGGTGAAMGFLYWPYDSGMLPTVSGDAASALFPRENPSPTQ